MIKTCSIFIALLAVLGLISCEHSYHLFIVNKSGNKQAVTVLNNYNVKTDSLKFFSAIKNPTKHNYKKAVLYRKTLSQDSIYKFEISDNEITMLLPLTFGTSVRAIVINSDTTYFDDLQGHFNKKFNHKWTDRYIYTIH